MKRFLALSFIVVLCGAFSFFNFGTDTASYQGYADAEYLRIAPALDGRLTALDVSKGDRLAKGAPLFTQDAVPDQASVAQAQAALDQARAQLKNAQDRAKETEITAFRAELADAQAQSRRAAADLARITALLPSGAATRQNFDAAKQAENSTSAQVRAAQARLDQALSPTGRTDEIAALSNGVAMAQAALDSAAWRLTQRRVTAPAPGRITEIFARPGEMAGANMPVVEMLPPQNILVRFFVSEAEIGAWHSADPVKISCDGCAADITARVSFIAPNAEYTPPVIYSDETRAKLVFMLEARPDPKDAEKLNPGQPVHVTRAAQP